VSQMMRCSCAVLCAVTLVAAVFTTTTGAQQSSPQIRVLSSRPDLVSGGDALVQAEPPGSAAPATLKVTVNGTDVTSALRAEGRSLVGVITGLTNGSNTLTVTGGGRTSSVTLVNHPITGPMISAPQEQPFVCMTERFKLLSGGTLGKPLDANCSIATRVDYVYRVSNGKDLQPLPDPKTVPPDVASVSVGGNTVRYIVRIETGTVNRAIYQIAMLHDPAKEPDPDFLFRPAGWNGRMIYTFGGGCEPGWYQQGASTGGVDDDVHLRRGYAVVSASLDVAGNNCNDLISAETMMMVKERFIERYGVPLFTIGWGSSGGAIQQHGIADNYPGLLDGLITGRSFADTAFASSTSSGDSRLLQNYFDKLAGATAYTDEQKRAIAGFANTATISNLSRVRAPRYNATERCPEGLPAEQRYDPVKNPKGARCTIWDHGANVYGRDPRTGFARRPLDNTGIQYGLEALRSGAITKEQFFDLNEKIGGFDIDGNIVPARMVADSSAVRAAYRSGRLTNGGGGLATVPIIDYRTYYDDLPAGDVHLRFQSFTTRARLEKANGHSDNQIMLLQDRRYGDFDTTSPVLVDALAQMDQWLTRIAEDNSRDPAIVKVRKAKPTGLVDACWTKDEVPQKIEEKQQYRAGRCNDLYPAFSFPRGVAGAPIANDVIKCQLKAIAASDYKVTFSADEMTRLRRIFPGGVCDWSKPGVEQQRLAATWQTFDARPSGGTGAP
jgi:hypothetical protein